MTRPALGLLGIALALAACEAPVFRGCAEPAFRMSVTFVGPLDVEPGADVRYQGVRVGTVERVSLQQPAPDRPARVQLSLVIEDASITLRESDLFEAVTDGLLGADYVRVTPSPGSSPPLAPGATVAGLPPFVTRVRDSTTQALDTLGDLARQKSEAVLEALAGLGDDAEAPPEADAPPGREDDRGAPAPGSVEGDAGSRAR